MIPALRHIATRFRRSIVPALGGMILLVAPQAASADCAVLLHGLARGSGSTYTMAMILQFFQQQANFIFTTQFAYAFHNFTTCPIVGVIDSTNKAWKGF